MQEIRRVILLFFLLFYSIVSSSQTNAEKGEDLLGNGRYNNALYYLQKALKETKDQNELADIYINIGDCHLMLLDEKLALKNFKRAHKYNKKRKGPLFMVGQSYKHLGNYKSAIKWFSKLSLLDSAAGRREIQACNASVQWLKEDSKYDIRFLDGLNSGGLDFSPVLIDENSMIITSSRNSSLPSMPSSLTNLFYSRKINGLWLSPSLMDSAKYTNLNIGAISFDSARDIMFFTMCPYIEGEKHYCGIYYTFIKGDILGEPIPLRFDNSDTVYRFAHPAYSAKLQALFFVSNIPGGYGNNDIWYSRYDSVNDSWGVPQNAGPQINTKNYEMFPYVNSNGDLFFSSDGHSGMGGLDIFCARLTGDFFWYEAENMKSPINSSRDDFGICFDSSNTSGYVSSNRIGGMGMDDIYRFYLKGYNEKKTYLQKQDSVRENCTYSALMQAFNRQVCSTPTDSLRFDVIQLSPNPSDGEFTIEYNCNKNIQLLLRIYDSFGRVFLLEPISIEAQRSSKSMSLNNAKGGVYYVQFIKGCETLVSKKLIMR